MDGHEVCVLDLGTARVKSSTWACTTGGLVLSQSSSIDLGELARTPEDILDSVAPIAHSANAQGRLVVITGGHRLRSDARMSELARALADEVSGAFLPLDGPGEGEMLAASNGVDADTLLVDVGGGSAQLIWSDKGSLRSESSAHGTYSIESRFDLPFGSAEADYENAIATIAGELGEVPQRRRLVAGSNVVGTFFDRLSRNLEGVGPTPWSPGELAVASRLVRGLEPNDFARVFPSMPGFLYGADKLLALLVAIAEFSAPAEVSGTDASISHGVAMTVASGLACVTCQNRVGQP